MHPLGAQHTDIKVDRVPHQWIVLDKAHKVWRDAVKTGGIGQIVGGNTRQLGNFERQRLPRLDELCKRFQYLLPSKLDCPDLDNLIHTGFQASGLNVQRHVDTFHNSDALYILASQSVYIVFLHNVIGAL